MSSLADKRRLILAVAGGTVAGRSINDNIHEVDPHSDTGVASRRTGLSHHRHSPCGFCGFVLYAFRVHAGAGGFRQTSRWAWNPYIPKQSGLLGLDSPLLHAMLLLSIISFMDYSIARNLLGRKRLGVWKWSYCWYLQRFCSRVRCVARIWGDCRGALKNKKIPICVRVGDFTHLRGAIERPYDVCLASTLR